MRAWSSRWGEVAAAAVGYALGVLYASWPLPAHLSSHLLLATGGIVSWERLDVDLVVWVLAWGAHALGTDPTSFFDANVFHPAPMSLASSENLLGLQPIAFPVYGLTGNAVLTYNVTVLFVSWLTGVTTFLAVRHFTRSAVAGFLAGAVLAFSPLVARDFVRLNESPIALFPIVLLLAWRAAEAPRARVLAALAVATAVQALAGMYIAYELALTILALSPALVWQARRNGRSGVAPLAAMGLGLLAVVPVALPYLEIEASGQMGQGASAAVQALSTSVFDNVVRLGREVTWPVAALATLGLAVGGSATRPLRVGLATTVLLGLLVAAGDRSPGVFQAFRAVVPGFDNIRLPLRLLVMAVFALSVASGLGASVLLDRVRSWKPRAVRAASAVAVVGAFGLFLRIPTAPLELRSMPAREGDWEVYDWLAEQEGDGAVLELPVLGSVHEAGVAAATGQYMIGSTRHWRPLLNGYSGYFPASHVVTSSLGQRLPDPRAFANLCASIDVEWLVVHGRLTPRAHLFLDSPLPLEPVKRFGRTAVYRVSRECGWLAPLLRAERAGERTGRTLRDHPVAELAVEHRRGVVSPELPEKLVGTMLQWVPVRVQNLSRVVWPGFSTNPEHRVGVEARWVPEGGSETIRAVHSMPLMADLRPGEELDVLVPLYVPRAGRYTLEIGLFQEGVGWFADTGGAGAFRKSVVATPWSMG